MSDAGRTEVAPGTHTVGAIGPDLVEKVDSITAAFIDDMTHAPAGAIRRSRASSALVRGSLMARKGALELGAAAHALDEGARVDALPARAAARLARRRALAALAGTGPPARTCPSTSTSRTRARAGARRRRRGGAHEGVEMLKTKD